MVRVLAVFTLVAMSMGAVSADVLNVPGRPIKAERMQIETWELGIAFSDGTIGRFIKD